MKVWHILSVTCSKLKMHWENSVFHHIGPATDWRFVQGLPNNSRDRLGRPCDPWRDIENGWITMLLYTKPFLLKASVISSLKQKWILNFFCSHTADPDWLVPKFICRFGLSQAWQESVAGAACVNTLAHSSLKHTCAHVCRPFAAHQHPSMVPVGSQNKHTSPAITDIWHNST